MDITGGFLGLGIIFAFVSFLYFFVDVEKEDPYTTHTIKKSKSSKHK